MTAALSQGDAERLTGWFGECLARGGGLPQGVEPVQTRLIRAVGRGVLADAGDCYVKVMGFPRRKDRLRYAVRPLPAAHEGRMLALAAAAGIACPTVLWVRGLRTPLPRLSMLVTAALPTAPPPPELPEAAAVAHQLVEAGIDHPDLHRENFLRLRDGSIAVLDLQSARQRAPGLGWARRRAIAARLLIGFPAREDALDALVASGLVRPQDRAATGTQAEHLRLAALVRRIHRCLLTSSEFVRESGWKGTLFRRRGDWPEGCWQPLGRPARQCWLGDRALVILDGQAPRLHALFRKSWWCRGVDSVYSPGRIDAPAFAEVVPTLLLGFRRYTGLVSGKNTAVRIAHSAPEADPS